jgi:transposase
MKPYSLDLRSRVIEAIQNQDGSLRQTARRFAVSVSFITRLLRRFRDTGSPAPKPHAGGQTPALAPPALARLQHAVAEQPDATLAELRTRLGLSCSLAALCRALQTLRLTRKKKTLKADEQNSPRVQAQRQQFVQEIAAVDPAHRVYVDETGATTDMTRRYARAPRGHRAYGSAPFAWDRLTTIGALRLSGVVASLAFPGGTDQPAFRTFVDRCLVPQLLAGDVVIWDNLNVHDDPYVIAAIEAVGARVLPLPPYSPDFSPIEEMFSKLKEVLRSLATRTIETLYRAIGKALRMVTWRDIAGWFGHRGLCATQA